MEHAINLFREQLLQYVAYIAKSLAFTRVPGSVSRLGVDQAEKRVRKALNVHCYTVVR